MYVCSTANTSVYSQDYIYLLYYSTEIIISMVKEEPIIYDKSIESKLNVIAVKKQIFDEISQAIHSCHDIFLSGRCMNSLYFNLKFK